MKQPPPEQLALPSPATVAHRAICDSRRPGLNAVHRAILHALARHMDRDGKSWPKVHTVAAEAGLETREAARANLARLASAEVIRRVHRPGFVSYYTINLGALASESPLIFPIPSPSDGYTRPAGIPVPQGGTLPVPQGGTLPVPQGGTLPVPQVPKDPMKDPMKLPQEDHFPVRTSADAGPSVSDRKSKASSGSLFASPPTEPDPPKAKRGKRSASDGAEAPKPKPASTRYAEAYSAGVSAGQGGHPFTAPVTQCKGAPFGRLLQTHARNAAGEALTGDELCAWIREQAEHFRRSARNSNFLTPADFGKWLDGGGGRVGYASHDDARRQHLPSDEAYLAERSARHARDNERWRDESRKNTNGREVDL